MKRLLVFFSICLIILMLSPAALAASDAIVDEADLLTQEQEDDLAGLALSIRNTYNMDVVVVVVSSLDGKTSQEYADDYYDYNGYGIGDDYSGVLFLQIETILTEPGFIISAATTCPAS